MKITKVVLTPVYIPMEAPLRWSMGVEHGTTRTIVELHTDDGVVGLGETYGGASTAARFHSAEPFFVGYDPLEVSRIIKNFEVFRTTSEQSALTIELRYVAAAIEMACWDIIGKIQNKRVCDLWGEQIANSCRSLPTCFTGTRALTGNVAVKIVLRPFANNTTITFAASALLD